MHVRSAKPHPGIHAIFALAVSLSLAGGAHAQENGPFTTHIAEQKVGPGMLDPVREAKGAMMESAVHQPLPEHYIWTAPDKPVEVGDKIVYRFPGVLEQTEPHWFRAHFNVSAVPHDATLYVAGPRAAKIFINGKQADEVTSDVTHPVNIHVFAVPVAALLRPGGNVLAMEVVRGRGVTGFTNSALVRQQTFGQVVVAKIVPAAPGLNAPAMMMSDASWRGTTKAASGWERAEFNDSAWPAVQDLAAIESSLDLFQWNADAGMYDWPGYDGISPFLAHKLLQPLDVLALFAGRGRFENNAGGLLSGGDVVLHRPAVARATDAAPSFVLDFGREITARLELASASAQPETVSIAYGESIDELTKVPYLGVNALTIAPGQVGHGPKTSFRYAKVQFLSGGPEARFKHIAADDIYYPVEYRGSFESSDPKLNRIWEVGAYTAHLCMQDDVWDSPKRDRGRWMGDTDVMGRTINDVFLDRFLMEDTLDRLLGSAPVQQHVNGIPGYSAFWFTGAAEYYRHTGSREFLDKTHERMLQLLQYVDKEFDANNLYANKTSMWLYVDWSPELNGDTPETRRATTLEFVRAYDEAAYLLREAGDNANADKYAARARQIATAARKSLVDAKTGTFGPRWQTNAAAVIGNVAEPADYDAIWRGVLGNVKDAKNNALVTTPYYGYYILNAMAQMNHREDALQWMRRYWGGMIDEGATSFWEAYDPDWFKQDFHASLAADNRNGYFVSLAHGWSSGPTPWLMENVLGIQSTGAGFKEAVIRPDLLDLQWARGAEPTPHGLLKVALSKEGGMTAVIDVPAGVRARVLMPGSAVTVNGATQRGEAAEGGARVALVLDKPGSYRVVSH